jgi:DNA-binding HxlR family transcriptional regulator
MAERDQLGARALALLSEDWMVAVLEGLAGGPMRPAELERALPRAGHSVVFRRLRRLLDDDLAIREHQRGVPPRRGSAAIPQRAYYSLTDAGCALLEVSADADRWERRWCSRRERGDPGGIVAIGLSADRRTRAVLLALADGPLAAAELQARLPGLSGSTLGRRLSRLMLGGMLERTAGARARRYSLTARARELAIVAMLAGRWEWRWLRPQRSAPARDLGELLRMIAPLARVSVATAGVCRVHLDMGADAQDNAQADAQENAQDDAQDVYLAVRAGGVLAVAQPPTSPANALGHATPATWCDALLAPPGRIEVAGDGGLMAAVIGALGAALRPTLPPESRPTRL